MALIKEILSLKLRRFFIYMTEQFSLIKKNIEAEKFNVLVNTLFNESLNSLYSDLVYLQQVYSHFLLKVLLIPGCINRCPATSTTSNQMYNK
jgi:hypothetical protein